MSALASTTVVPLYAGFWRRGAAALLDGLILVVPDLIIAAFVPGFAGALVQIVVNGLYYVLLTASPSQATLGKRAFGIKVTGLDGGRIGFGRALGRYLAAWISALILFIGFLLAAFTGRKQALHDFIAGTLVVNRVATPAEVSAGGGTMPVTGGVWAMIVLLLILPFFGGMLAAIAIPAYQDYTIRSKVAAAMQLAAPLREEVERASAEKRAWKVGPVPVDGIYAQAAEVTSDGHVVITLANNVGGGGRIRFAPSGEPGSLHWRCSSQDVAPKYLPVSCRQQ